MTEVKTPPSSGPNVALIAFVAFAIGVAAMYALGVYFANREGAANAGNHDAS